MGTDFCRGDISVICPIIALKLTATVSTSLHFRTLRPVLFFIFIFEFGLWLKNDQKSLEWGS